MPIFVVAIYKYRRVHIQIVNRCLNCMHYCGHCFRLSWSYSHVTIHTVCYGPYASALQIILLLVFWYDYVECKCITGSTS